MSDPETTCLVLDSPRALSLSGVCFAAARPGERVYVPVTLRFARPLYQARQAIAGSVFRTVPLSRVTPAQGFVDGCQEIGGGLDDEPEDTADARPGTPAFRRYSDVSLALLTQCQIPRQTAIQYGRSLSGSRDMAKINAAIATLTADALAAISAGEIPFRVAKGLEKAHKAREHAAKKAEAARFIPLCAGFEAAEAEKKLTAARQALALAEKAVTDAQTNIGFQPDPDADKYFQCVAAIHRSQMIARGVISESRKGEPADLTKGRIAIREQMLQALATAAERLNAEDFAGCLEAVALADGMPARLRNVCEQIASEPTPVRYATIASVGGTVSQ